MYTVYIYVLDTLADWELGFITPVLNSDRFHKKDAEAIELKRVSFSKEPITTMGGFTITPDCVIDDIIVSKKSVLILPGGDTWKEPKHNAILEKAKEFLSVGATVCAICGATAALASVGILDNRPHTSNGPGFLEAMEPNYKGQSFYIDKPAVADSNLITAACFGALLWAKQIVEHLGVFRPDTLEFWYNYFSKGNPNDFFGLMNSLQGEK